MNHDLQLVSQWAHKWRMSFNPDPQKQAVEVLFSRKRSEIDHPVLLFNNIPVKKVNEHKHLGIILDSKLSFLPHIKAAISKTRKGIGLLKYLSIYLPRHTLNVLISWYCKVDKNAFFFLLIYDNNIRPPMFQHLISLYCEVP